MIATDWALSPVNDLQVSDTVSPAIEPSMIATDRVPSPFNDLLQPDDFMESGTPEITFRRRRPGRLSLQCRTYSRSVNCVPSLQDNSSRSPINIIDSEDEDIQQAIQASLQNDIPVKGTDEVTEDMVQILAEFKKNAVLPDVTTKVIVYRNDVLQSALRALDRKALNLNARLFVKFSVELGQDYGGPRREFFRYRENVILAKTDSTYTGAELFDRL